MIQPRILLLFWAISLFASQAHARECGVFDRLDRAYASYVNLTKALARPDRLNAANVLRYDLRTLNAASVTYALEGTSMMAHRKEILVFLQAAETLSSQAARPGPLLDQSLRLENADIIATAGRRLSAFDCRTDTRLATGATTGHQDGQDARTGVDLMAGRRQNALDGIMETAQRHPLTAILSGLGGLVLLAALVLAPRVMRSLSHHTKNGRRARRINLSLDIPLDLKGASLIVRTSDISKSGLKIERPFTPSHAKGDPVGLRIEDQPFQGRIVWLNDTHMGVQLNRPVPRKLFRTLARRARKNSKSAITAPQAPQVGSV
ncbi:PilZ domain-containing protein [Aestuariibius insulae]|uniref:PilZ domain-containing protein n=1 Tax=Aestuariibius insulae TaxID=2058287 RepID=UPI00345E948D